MKLRRLLFLMVVISGVAHSGGVYKWVDEKGQVHFGDKPTVGTQNRRIDVEPAAGYRASGSDSGIRPGEQDMLDKYNSRINKKVAARRTTAKELESDKRACQGARDRYNEAVRKRREESSTWAEKSYYKDMVEACR